jgi:urea transport system permease protein
VAMAETYLTSALPELWLFALGALFILVTIALPRGILGLVEDTLGKLKMRAKPPPEPVAKEAKP